MRKDYPTQRDFPNTSALDSRGFIMAYRVESRVPRSVSYDYFFEVPDVQRELSYVGLVSLDNPPEGLVDSGYNLIRKAAS